MKSPTHARSSSIERLEDRQLLAVGALDPSFSGDGKTTLDPGTTSEATDVAVQSDGKVVVVGRASSNGNNFVVARFNVDGSPDTSFGKNHSGFIRTHLGDTSNLESATAVAIDTNGRIVVGGWTSQKTVRLVNRSFAIERLLPNGTLDTSFDGDGERKIVFKDFADIPVNSQGFDLAIQSNGKILLTGYLFAGNDEDFMTMRFNDNGALDGTFNGGGKRSSDFGGDDQSLAVAIDTNGNSATNPNFGSIIVAGYTQSSAGIRSIAVAKYSSNSSPVLDFGNRSKVILSLPGTNLEAESVFIQPGGRILLAGRTAGANQPGGSDFFVARLNSNGTLDNSFGTNNGGFVVTDFGGGFDRASVILPNAAGDGLLVAGLSGRKFAVAQYTNSGALDSRLGAGGKVTTDFGVELGGGNVVGLAKHGRRFVVAGGDHLKTARYLDAGANVVSVGALDPNASEPGTNKGTLIVARTERLPTPTRVFFNITGTAKRPGSSPTPVGDDYSLDTMGGLFSGTPFVDIPANETFTLVSLTAIDDLRIEGTERATFTIAPNANYEIGTPSTADIDIDDNDQGATVAVGATADAFVQDGTAADTNFGGDANLRVKTSGAGFNRISYLKFDISAIGAIQSVKLQLFGSLNDTQNASVVTSLFPVADTSWSESGITFNNKPAPGASALGSATIVGTTPKLYEFDVTNFLKQEQALGHKIVSFALKNPASSASQVVFNSREASANHPTLSVVTSSTSVGTFKVAAQTSAHTGQTVNVAVTWTVPSGSWRQLTDIQLILRGEGDLLILIDWNEAANTLRLFDPFTGKFGEAKALGSENVLSNRLIDVLLKSSSTKAAGPTSPVVTVNFALRFNHSAAGHRFRVEAIANNDFGAKSFLESAGALTVS